MEKKNCIVIEVASASCFRSLVSVDLPEDDSAVAVITGDITGMSSQLWRSLNALKHMFVSTYDVTGKRCCLVHYSRK